MLEPPSPELEESDFETKRPLSLELKKGQGMHTLHPVRPGFYMSALFL